MSPDSNMISNRIRGLLGSSGSCQLGRLCKKIAWGVVWDEGLMGVRSTTHVRADWLLHGSLEAKWTGLLITYLVVALSNAQRIY